MLNRTVADGDEIGRSQVFRPPIRLPKADVTMIGLTEILRSVRRHLLLVFLIVGLGTLVAFLYAVSQPNIYTAYATLVLERNDTQVSQAIGQIEQQASDRLSVETVRDVIRSRLFAGRLVDSLDLIHSPSFNTYLPRPEDPNDSSSDASIVDRLRAAISDLRHRFASEPGPLPPEEVQHDRAVTTLLSRVRVTRNNESLAIQISVSSEDREEAAALANAYSDEYVNWSLEQKRQATSETVAFLKERLAQLGTQIAESERQVADYSREHQLANASRADLLSSEMTQLNVQLTNARVERAEAEARLRQVKQRLDTGGAEDAGKVLTSPLLSTLRSQASDLVRQRAELASSYGARHPKVVDADAQIASVREMISNEIDRIVLDLENEVSVGTARVEQFETQLAALEENVRRRDLAEIKRRDLERNLKTDQERYQQMALRLGNLDRQEEKLKPSAQVVSAAATPTGPSAPNRKLILGGGFIGSMMVAVFAAFMMEASDKRIRTSTRVADLTQLPNLAYVPKAPLHKGGPPTPFHYAIQQQQSTYAEAIRSLYLACWLTNIDDPPQVIMFNSALPGEGKTTMALSLGAVAAAQGRRVVVVDLDLHRGGVSNALDLDMTDVDLADYLRGKCSIEDITLTDVELEGLDVIPVRPRTNRPSVLLDSNLARQLIDSLRAHYDLIILDTPPVLAVSDTAWLSQFVDAAVLVLRWGASTEDALQDALSRLNMTRAPLLGTVINMVDPRVQARHDYGGPLKYAEQAKSYYVN